MSKWERGGVRDRVRVSENGHRRQKNRDRERERERDGKEGGGEEESRETGPTHAAFSFVLTK